MKTKPAPKTASSPPPLGSYVAEFEQWMRNSARGQKGTETEDILQEIRLALWEIRDTPATLEQARHLFLRLVNIFELRAKRQMLRQGTLVESPEELAGSIERDTVRMLALLNALEKLTDHERWLVKECKIDGRTYADVAKQVGVTEEAITSRLWRAMARLLAIFEDENGDEKTQKRGAVIAPLAFEFTDVQRAAFSAIWRAEGRVPSFGGGPPNPPGPPPIVPGVPPVAPAVSAAVGSVVSAVTIAIVLVLLVFFPTGIVAIYYFWNPPLAQTANKGLHAPPVSVVEDVVPMDFAPHQSSSAQTPAASSSASVPATSSRTPVRPSDAPSSPLGPDEINRARRQIPRFLPSMK